ncbi:MAG: TonB-dependent receptor, partial [Gammaproteobacteria bacterium]|nr:TonB-dependent receptor [Gammaproteobacteria bacterium]
FVPGIISILHSSDLQYLGVRTVNEALVFLPGIESSIAADGQVQLIIRGTGKVFSSGKIKFLLNHIPQNSVLNGANAVGLLPIEFVERIEVIRGPGSATYGEYAFTGVVNIITKKYSSLAYAHSAYPSHQYAGLLLAKQFRTSKRPLNTNLSFSMEVNKGDSIKAGEDFLHETPLSSISYSPGFTNEKQQNLISNLSVDYGHWYAEAQLSSLNSGDYFGMNHVLSNQNETLRHVKSMTARLGNQLNLSENQNLHTYVGARYYRLNSDPLVFLPKDSPGFSASDMLGSPNYLEREINLGLAYQHKITSHQLSIGIHSSYLDQGDSYAIRNFNPDDMSYTPLATFRGAKNWISENNKRFVFSAHAEDSFLFKEKFNLVTGIRLDHYSDVGQIYTPRIAGLYQLSSSSMLKLQYAKAFRPPTFLELYTQNNPIINGNPNILAESIKVYEAGYIFNNGVYIFRSTLFLSDIHDQISDLNSQYINSGEIHSSGIELEAKAFLFSNLSLNANASYSKTEDYENKIEASDVANLLGTAFITYHVAIDWTVNISHHYIGSRKRSPFDYRSKLPAQHYSNLVIISDRLFKQKIKFEFTFNNIFDSAIRDPAPVRYWKNTSSYLPTYADDFPRLGRHFSLGVVWEP